MSNFTCYVGEQIRKYRKAGKMTCRIWQMPSIKVELPYANMKMEISPLISKLYMRSARFSRYLCPSLPLVFLKQPVNRQCTGKRTKKPIFQAQRLYFYFYDGRYQRTKDGVIDIYEKRRIRKIRSNLNDLFCFCQRKKQ